MQETEYPRPKVGPSLWNPQAAILWSLLLSPIFGALVHAANWRSMGMPERAKPNMIWVWATIVLLVLGFASIFVPALDFLESLSSPIGIGLFVSWAVAMGRPQVDYVRTTFGASYVKKGWAVPLLIGVAVIGVYIGLVLVIAFATFKPGSDMTTGR